MLGRYPCFADCKARRLVLVEHLAPLAVDVVDLRAIPERVLVVAAALSEARLAGVVGPVFKRAAVDILGKRMGHIDAEAVGAAVAPEAQSGFEVLVDLGVLPVEVGLLYSEEVQIPFAVANRLPRRAAEGRLPAVGGQLPVLAPARAEDVAVALRRAGARCERCAEPFVLGRRMVGHDVHDHLHAGGVGGCSHLVEVFERAQARVHVAVVRHIISAIDKGRRVERREPDGIDAKSGQVIDLCRDARDVAKAVPVGIVEAARVHLVHYRLLPPISMCVGHEKLLSTVGRTPQLTQMPDLVVVFANRSVRREET